ncbi:30S ribosomal protein S4 [Candidatus Parcubacteria bacterium]|nr:30S ribosomal protein S4 [Candidatus Parcubacteria bacterium]
MKIGPKYKIARRLGAPIFEKTQTQKYALSYSRKEKNGMVPQRPKSEFGKQLIEKQKARLTYGLAERQFKTYVKSTVNSPEPTQKLFRALELRLDNILYRSGFAKTRAAARQMAAHGHGVVNGRRVTIPSMHLRIGDEVSVREGSQASPLFAEVVERQNQVTVPAWLQVEPGKRVRVVGLPAYVQSEHVFDLGAVLEFYSR